MNVLIVSSRQLNPEAEWNVVGIRNLLEQSITGRINWVLYDTNPDLRYEKSPKTHRLKLNSNSFHHNTLHPFSAVILASGNRWTGHALEVLYGLLSKQSLPLMGFGLDVANLDLRLSSIEQICFQRFQNSISVTDAESRVWFEKNGISPFLSPSPTLFAAPRGVDKFSFSSPTKILFAMEDTQKAEPICEEGELRALLSWLTNQQLRFEVAALTVDDFMRFSSLFPDKVRYSFESTDYFPWFNDADIVVTFSTETALLANSFLRPAILLGKPSGQLELTPFIFPTEIDQLNKAIEHLKTMPTLARDIYNWKQDIKMGWKQWLQRSRIEINREPPTVESWT
jgi:hypothetical protein